MGIHLIKMPDIGEGIAEVELAGWHAAVGDPVREDQPLADVMTDKASIEVPSPVAGRVWALGGKPGQHMVVGAPLIAIEVDGAGNVDEAEATALFGAAAAADGRNDGAAGTAAATGAGDRSVGTAPASVAAPHAGADTGAAQTAVAPGSNAAPAAGATAAGAGASGSGDGSGTGIGSDTDAGASTGGGSGTRADAGVSGSSATGSGTIYSDTTYSVAAGSGSATGARTAAATSAPGDSAPRATASHRQPGSAATAAAGGARMAPSASGTGVPGASGQRLPGERPLASPAVRRRAWDLGIELRFVTGSGPHGRILHEDLERHLQRRHQGVDPQAASPQRPQREGTQQVPVIGLRRRIAEKMQTSKRRIPHFTYVEEVDVTELETLRAQLNARYGETRGKLTMIPFIARAMVLALQDFPQLNARYDDEAGVVTRYEGVHLGIATQTDDGLMVVVVRHAESRDLWGNAAEVLRLADAARRGKATREELSGSTITLTSLGALGGIVSTPVINHPEVGIVAVNRLVEKPVVMNGQIAIRKTMNLSSSFDHRVVDGMDAARFIQAVRALLQTPAMLFV